MRIRDADGATLHDSTGSGSTVTTTWDGLVDGVAVADGTYADLITASDAWSHEAAITSGLIRVGTVASSLPSSAGPEAVSHVLTERRRRRVTR